MRPYGAYSDARLFDAACHTLNTYRGYKMNHRIHEMISRVESLGVSTDDAFALRRISMTLCRWFELECGDDTGCIERDEKTSKPFLMRHYPITGKIRAYAIADRERGALKRLAIIMARYPELAAYVQGDPRGASLYIYRKDSPMLAASKYGIESCYSSVGYPLYKGD